MSRYEGRRFGSIAVAKEVGISLRQLYYWVHVLRIVQPRGAVTRWNPRTGARVVLRERALAGDVLTIELGPAETTLLTFAGP